METGYKLWKNQKTHLRVQYKLNIADSRNQTQTLFISLDNTWWCDSPSQSKSNTISILRGVALWDKFCTFYICRVTSDFIKTALSTICAEQLNMCVIFPALLYHKCLFSVEISFKFTCISFFLIILQIFFSRIENLCRLI